MRPLAWPLRYRHQAHLKIRGFRGLGFCGDGQSSVYRSRSAHPQMRGSRFKSRFLMDRVGFAASSSLPQSAPREILAEPRPFPQTMRHSLQSHIIYLEVKIQNLRDRLATPHLTPDDTQELKAQIFHAGLALEHYRKAYALELSVSNPEPPDAPDNWANCGSESPGGSKPKKKGGLARIMTRKRKKARAGCAPRMPGNKSASVRFR
jgi:hypothetical protein